MKKFILLFLFALSLNIDAASTEKPAPANRTRTQSEKEKHPPQKNETPPIPGKLSSTPSNQSREERLLAAGEKFYQEMQEYFSDDNRLDDIHYMRMMAKVGGISYYLDSPNVAPIMFANYNIAWMRATLIPEIKRVAELKQRLAVAKEEQRTKAVANCEKRIKTQRPMIYTLLTKPELPDENQKRETDRLSRLLKSREEAARLRQSRSK